MNIFKAWQTSIDSILTDSRGGQQEGRRTRRWRDRFEKYPPSSRSAPCELSAKCSGPGVSELGQWSHQLGVLATCVLLHIDYPRPRSCRVLLHRHHCLKALSQQLLIHFRTSIWALKVCSHRTSWEWALFLILLMDWYHQQMKNGKAWSYIYLYSFTYVG